MLERDEAGGEFVLYRGYAHLPDRDVPVEVRLNGGAAEGQAGRALPGALGAAEPEREGDAELARAAASYVRAAAKAALASGRPPPRRVVRWRG